VYSTPVTAPPALKETLTATPARGMRQNPSRRLLAISAWIMVEAARSQFYGDKVCADAFSELSHRLQNGQIIFMMPDVGAWLEGHTGAYHHGTSTIIVNMMYMHLDFGLTLFHEFRHHLGEQHVEGDVFDDEHERYESCGGRYDET
jgi:hypothetical protein